MDVWLLVSLTLAIVSVRTATDSVKFKRSVPSGSVVARTGARGSGASGARTAVPSYSAPARSASAQNPDGGFMPSSGFVGGVGGLRKSASGFIINVRRARDKVAHSIKNIRRPKGKVPRPLVDHPYSPVLKTVKTSAQNKEKLIVGGTDGYFLGRILAQTKKPMQTATTHSQDQKYYYESYVPFRSRFAPDPVAAGRTDAEISALQSNKTVDMCMLHRWNQELPFTELPNMAMEFLANNAVSGRYVHEKSGFLSGFLQNAKQTYGSLESSQSLFVLPAGYDFSACQFQSAEEPFDVGIKHVREYYCGSKGEKDNLYELVEAVEMCLPKRNETVSAKVYPCLDYSIDAAQVLQLQDADSVFGNDELCRKYLSPRVLDCDHREEGGCSVHHLVSINMFARNFYLCSEAVHPATVLILQDEVYLRQYDLSTAPLQFAGNAWVRLLLSTLSAVSCCWHYSRR